MSHHSPSRRDFLAAADPSRPDGTDLSEGLAAMLGTALAIDPGERHDSALEFRDAIRWAGLER